MKFRPIIIVAGEPNSVFIEIFFKILKKKIFKSPIILICSKKILLKQSKVFNSKIKFNDISKEDFFLKKKKIK